MFDSCADSSHISANFRSKINAEWVQRGMRSYCGFGQSSATTPAVRDVYSISLIDVNGNAHNICLTEDPVLCADLRSPPIPSNLLTSLGDVPLITVSPGVDTKIDIILGMDVYWRFVTGKTKRLTDSLVAEQTLFGWIVSGSLMNASSKSALPSHQLILRSTPTLDDQVQSLWDLESIGILSSEKSIQEEQVVSKFEETVFFENGQYVVSLPWKSDIHRPVLVDNFHQANQRLFSLERKFKKSPELGKRYYDVLDDYEKQGFVEEVAKLPINAKKGPPPTTLTSTTGTSNQSNVSPAILSSGPSVYYLPHHAVVKEHRQTSKVRPVFDASCKSYNGVSLNDCLLTGPNLIPSIISILIRFRRWRVVICADITKAFHQILVRPCDRDCHRFLLPSDGYIRVMRFKVVPFGNKSSPFLLNATIKHHLKQYQPSHTVTELGDNLYIDDFISGHDEVQITCNMIKEADRIMGEGHFHMCKWVSNDPTVADLLKRDFSSSLSQAGSAEKVLGMGWDPTDDSFYFDGIPVPSNPVVTKRLILSVIARFYDPLGFLAPVTVVGKMLLQKTWRLGLKWDQTVDADIQSAFLSWLESLSTLRGFRITRRVSTDPWSDLKVAQLHAFGDASE